MSSLKKLVLSLLILFIVIQFIQPARNKSGQVLPSDITKMYSLPENVQSVFKTACYDCHSNNTNYPLYVHIQPMGWLMAWHINNGKENLNFSEFGSYSKRKQFNKLRAIETSIREGSMPISSYTLMHSNAKLGREDKKLITDWVSITKDSLSTKN